MNARPDVLASCLGCLFGAGLVVFGVEHVSENVWSRDYPSVVQILFKYRILYELLQYMSLCPHLFGNRTLEPLAPGTYYRFWAGPDD
ncbi:hypothetical protein FRC12_004781 [Ceratobasidium sp. 428]|nr:hypothetical protein FRC12_004781 [Ceratobasidium sp. 428]